VRRAWPLRASPCRRPSCPSPSCRCPSCRAPWPSALRKPKLVPRRAYSAARARSKRARARGRAAMPFRAHRARPQLFVFSGRRFTFRLQTTGAISMHRVPRAGGSGSSLPVGRAVRQGSAAAFAAAGQTRPTHVRGAAEGGGHARELRTVSTKPRAVMPAQRRRREEQWWPQTAPERNRRAWHAITGAHAPGKGQSPPPGRAKPKAWRRA
jgi:hypothetical protein